HASRHATRLRSFPTRRSSDLRAADAGDADQIVAGGSHEAVQAALRGEQPVGDAQRATAATAAAEHERDELVVAERGGAVAQQLRSEEYTSELQSPDHLVCRLL